MQMSEAMREHFERLRSVSPKRLVQDGGRLIEDPFYEDPIDDWEGEYRFDVGLCVCKWD